MNKKSVAKKIVALAGATFMAGLTVASGVSAQLSDYPAQFMDNGQFDGKIVVGANAAAEDIIGAIDIAASLQAASVSPVDSDVSVEVDVEGDAKRVAASGSVLELGEEIGDTLRTLTSDDLEMLEDGRVSTEKGATAFTQTMYLRENTEDVGEVRFERNHDRVVADYLYFAEDAWFAEYELDFESGLESDNSSNTAEDFEDEVITIMGQSYTISDATLTNAGGLTLELLAGEVSDTLQEGETKTYTLDGEEYEVTVLVVGQSGSSTTVKFLVNGEVSDAMGVDETDTVGGIELGVREIIETTAYRESDPSSIVEFYLGANKVVLTDSDITDSTFGSMEVDEEDVNTEVRIDGSFVAGDVRVDTLTFRFYIEAAEDSGIYVGDGDGLRAQLDEDSGNGMLNPDWDIVYMGMTQPATATIAFEPRGEDEIELTFTNVNGDEYLIPFLGAEDQNTLVFGEADPVDGNDLIVEEITAPASYTNVSDWAGAVTEDDWFIITNEGAALEDDDDTFVLQFTGVDEDSRLLELEHVATGNAMTARYDLVGANLSQGATGTIRMGGEEWDFSLTEISNDLYLAVDLDNDGSMNAGEFADIVTKYGGILQLEAITSGTPDTVNVTLLTQGDKVDDGTDDTHAIAFTAAGSATEPAISIALPSADWTWKADVYREDITEAMTIYGAHAVLTDETDGADELVIEYPAEQREALVYVTGGDVQASARTVGAGDAGVVNVLPVGLAVLDTEIDVDDSNIISVGGPCANSVSAELLGNPADCAEGFQPGMGMIRYFETGDNVAVLVAGFSAQDTVQTSQVLARAATEDVANLEGESVEVVIAGANDVTVRAAVEADMDEE